MIIIKTLHFDNYMDMVLAVSDMYEEVTNKDELNSVCVIAKYEEAREILSTLISSMGYGIACIDISDVLANNYADEYVISLFENKVWCEPAKRGNVYLTLECDYVYLLDNCNSKIVPKIESDEVYEVCIGDFDDEYDDECTCSECKYSATYKVNDKNVNKDEYEKVIEDIKKKYSRSIRDMLLGYSEFLDEMNEWRKLLNW